MISSLTRAAAVLALVGSSAWSGMRASRPTPPRVSVEGGMLEGGVDSATGVVVFRGIPYAAPPVGRLRWRPPERAARWTGVRRADQLGKNCVQTQIYGDIDPFAAGVSEDCLYLNVWTTELSTAAAPRPVMVWIHGGGFRAGFGGEERHNGARLAQKGAVVVTLNYRLGPLGFLAHPALAAESPRHSSGNYGLLDQIAALQWVRRNISRFGGDPARVTVFGESAGGMSVGALIASPLAKGLFHRAILESGTGIGFGIRGRDSAFAQGVQFAELLGAVDKGRNAAAQLRATNAETLFAALRPPPNGPPPNPLAFLPVVDGWVLPLPVDSALLQRRANLVPVLVGSNGDEDAGVFGAPARAFARLVAARHVPAYLYLFTRAGEDSASRARGAYHSAEITFVFGRPRPLLELAGHAAYDSTLAEAMSDYWVAFATNGDPNGPPTAGRWPRWPEYDSTREAYIELGPEIAARTEPRKALYDSLDNIARSRGGIRP